MLCYAVLWCAATSSRADPYEVNPASAHTVIDAAWGDSPGEFTWPGDGWGIGEVSRFGPFALDDSGRIYLTDLVRNEVKIFDRDGRFAEAVPMLQEPNLVDDLAVYDGAIYWFGETPWGIRVVGVRPGSPELIDVELTTDPVLTYATDGGRITGNCRLVVGQEGLEMYTLRPGASFPLLRGKRVVPVAEQSASRRYGLSTDSGVGIMTCFEPAMALSGESVGEGEIVRVLPDGRIERVLVRNCGWIWGVAGDYFLHPDCETVEGEHRCYFVLRDVNGTLLSRIRTPKRNTRRTISIDKRFRLAPDGSFYGLYVDDDGVRVRCWR